MLVVFGVKAIANFATVFVPLFIVVVLYASFVMFQSNPLSSLFNTPALVRRFRWAPQPPSWLAALSQVPSALPITVDFCVTAPRCSG